MKLLKRLFAALCCLTLFAVSLCPAPAFALEEDEPQGIAVRNAGFDEPSLLFLPTGEDLNAILGESNSVSGEVFVQYGYWGLLSGCSLAGWSYEGFDSSVTGLQTVTSRVILPEGYFACDADGNETEVYIEQAVLVFSDDMQALAEVDFLTYPTYDALLIPRGSSAEETELALSGSITGSASFILDNTWIIRCGDEVLSWDAAKIDTSKAGIYYPFSFELSPGLKIKEAGLKRTPLAAVVLEPNSVDLTGMFYDSLRGSFHANWIYEASEPVLWVTTDDPFSADAEASWEPFSVNANSHERQSYSFDNMGVDVYLEDSSINIEFLVRSGCQLGGDYWFQVRYEGGQSNIWYIRFADGETLASGTVGGDRIGDIDGNKNPPIVTVPRPPLQSDYVPPSPNVSAEPTEPLPGDDEPEEPGVPGTETPTESPVAENPNVSKGSAQGSGLGADLQSLFNELGSETPAPSSLPGIVMTGAELRALMAAKPEQVPFRDNDVQVWVPTDALAALSVGDEDVFAVRIDHRPGKWLDVRFTVNDMPVSLGAAFTVGIAWSGGDVLCSDENGEPVGTEYDSVNKLLLISFDGCSCVLFTSGSAETEASAPISPTDTDTSDLALETKDDRSGPSGAVYAVAGVVGGGGVGGITLWLRRKRKGA